MRVWSTLACCVVGAAPGKDLSGWHWGSARGGTGQLPVSWVHEGQEGKRWEQCCHEVVPIQVTRSLTWALPLNVGSLCCQSYSDVLTLSASCETRCQHRVPTWHLQPVLLLSHPPENTRHFYLHFLQQLMGGEESTRECMSWGNHSARHLRRRAYCSPGKDEILLLGNKKKKYPPVRHYFMIDMA